MVLNANRSIITGGTHHRASYTSVSEGSAALAVQYIVDLTAQNIINRQQSSKQ